MIKKLFADKFLWYATFLGVVCTLWQYEFGKGDQLDHLLFVLKSVDANFLSNDFYVDAMSGFSVRYYFAHFVAFLVNLSSVPVTFFILTFISNILLAVFTFLVGRKLSENSISGIVASVFVCTLTTINMGDVPTIYATGLAPDRLSFPLIIAAFYSTINQKTVQASVWGGIASVFHIMLGAVVTSVILIAAFISDKYGKQANTITIYFKAFGLLAAFALLNLVPHFMATSGQNSSTDLIQTYALFRVPHHLVPTTIFANGILWRSLAFFAGAVIAGLLLFRQKTVELRQLQLFALSGIIFFLLCVAGYLFIEIWPNNISVYLQAFRYLTFIKWLALVLVGCYVGQKLSQEKTLVSGLYLFASVLSPFLMCFSFCFEAFYRSERLLRIKTFLWPYLALFFVLAYLGYKALNPETMGLFIWLLLVLSIVYLSKKVNASLVLVYSAFILLNITYLSKASLYTSWFKQNFNPVFEFKPEANLKIDIAMQLKELTEKDAVILASPDMPEVRAIGQRASVVNFKTVPLIGQALKEWKSRLDFCYGKTNEVGFLAEAQLKDNYKNISDKHLFLVKEKYGITYAILFNSTPTHFQTLYSNSAYKLVRVE